MSTPSLWRTICLVCVFCAVAAIGSPAQTFTTLVSFNGTDGQSPLGSLIQGLDGNFYGTTYYGPTCGAFCFGNGTVFKVTPGGTLTTHTFDGADGQNPDAGLVQATNGNFYGTTRNGGFGTGCSASGCGTVFEFAVTAGGALITLDTFDRRDGAFPSAGLVQAADGNLYGTTPWGGSGCSLIYSGCGTVFKINPAGALTTLHSFDHTDGYQPYAGLVQATNGNFYGTTQYGGANTCFGGGCGTVFEITPGGTLTTLYSFCAQTNCTDGVNPYAGLVQATDGNLYGTNGGGANGDGTIFKITAAGALTTLHSFDGTDGSHPIAGLVQD
jgi:uncharacterized repeat protein (TIGR03803 family)